VLELATTGSPGLSSKYVAHSSKGFEDKVERAERLRRS
jgi:hypothetical protein